MTLSLAATRHTEKRIFLHASAIEYQGKALLFVGKPGSGKSSLVISYIQKGAKLIADDFVCLESDGNSVKVRPAAMVSGLIERYGVGIARLPFLCSAELSRVIILDEESNLPNWIGHCANVTISHRLAA